MNYVTRNSAKFVTLGRSATAADARRNRRRRRRRARERTIASGPPHRAPGPTSHGQAGQVGVPIEDGIAGLLDEVAAEDDGRLGVRYDDDQVVTGMSTPGVGDRHRPAAEIDVRLTDRVLGRPKRRDGASPPRRGRHRSAPRRHADVRSDSRWSPRLRVRSTPPHRQRPTSRGCGQSDCASTRYGLLRRP